MALISCSACHRASLNSAGICDYCGKVLKFSIWTRNLRRKEAYGVLLIFTGMFLLSPLKLIAITMLLSGVIMICFSIFTPRRPMPKNQSRFSCDELNFLI